MFTIVLKGVVNLNYKLLLCTLLIILVGVSCVLAEDWPAESFNDAIELTDIEGSGINDFYYDLSGAVWNSETDTLWVCRNGPEDENSKIWAIVRNISNSSHYFIDYIDEDRGEWSNFSDLEGITQANFEEVANVYAIIEGDEVIREYDLSTYGTAILNNEWDVSSYLPLSENNGAEAITFVPDEFLSEQGFVDENGDLYTSQNGMNGLMFVGHQNGGRIYVFDLDRSNSTFDFIGEYYTDYSEIADLEFDRSTGALFILHGASYNSVEVSSLSSEVYNDGRKFGTIVHLDSPTDSTSSDNIEGLAIEPIDNCVDDKRNLYLTVDDGDSKSLLLFQEFPCYFEMNETDIPELPDDTDDGNETTDNGGDSGEVDDGSDDSGEDDSGDVGDTSDDEQDSGNESTTDVRDYNLIDDTVSYSGSRDRILLNRISVDPLYVNAGDYATIYLDTVTSDISGDDKEGVQVKVMIPELLVYMVSTHFDMDNGDKVSPSIEFEIPYWAEPGVYDVRIVVSDDYTKRVKHREIIVE